jgi:hypothetical protein
MMGHVILRILIRIKISPASVGRVRDQEEAVLALGRVTVLVRNL